MEDQLSEDIRIVREALAAGPTPGPWRAQNWGDEHGADWYVDADKDLCHIRHGSEGNVAEMNYWDNAAGERDMKYIAACSPERITRLLAALEKALPTT